MMNLNHVALPFMSGIVFQAEFGLGELVKVLNDIVAKLLHAGLLILQELVEDIPPA